METSCCGCFSGSVPVKKRKNQNRKNAPLKKVIEFSRISNNPSMSKDGMRQSKIADNLNSTQIREASIKQQIGSMSLWRGQFDKSESCNCFYLNHLSLKRFESKFIYLELANEV